MKLLAIVVTYYPDVEEAIINIKQYIDFVDKLIIWENTPIDDREAYKIKILDYSSKIVYLGTDNNEGMAFALNQGVRWGIKNEYTHILTMDQDSYFIDFSKYKSNLNNLIGRKDIGIFSLNVNFERPDIGETLEVLTAITSGAIYDLTIFTKIGLFREDYFIDAVDLEFCLRAKKNNLSTVVLCDCHLEQQYGNGAKGIFGLWSTNYSALRTYYIIRNHIWLWREYPEMMNYNIKRFLIWESVIRRSIVILLQESNKWAKYKFLIKGLYDGLTKKIEYKHE